MKIIVISDTHSREKKIIMPETSNTETNVLIHCGDFSHSYKTFDNFLTWFSEVPGYKHKILIAGNHDEITWNMGYNKMRQICYTLDIIYLQDTGIEIEGINFWGSPWSVEYGGWPFMKDDFELDQMWKKIPDNTNVLITHGPAYGKCDEVNQDISVPNVGSRTLEMRTRELKELTYHFVGHIHDQAGEIYQDENFLTYNASIMDFFFMPTGLPHTFSI